MPMLGLTAALQHVTAPCIWDTISTSEFYLQHTICSNRQQCAHGRECRNLGHQMTHPKAWATLGDDDTG